MNVRPRLQRLEQRLRHECPAHVTGMVRVPADIPHEAWHPWLAEQPCACGVVGCPQRRIGVLVPTLCQTPEEWERRYARS